MGRPGQAITLLGREDGPKWRQIERGLIRRIPRAPWRGAAAALAANPDDIDTSYQPEPASARPGQPGQSGRSLGPRDDIADIQRASRTRTRRRSRASPYPSQMATAPATETARTPVPAQDQAQDQRPPLRRSDSIFGARPDARRSRHASVIADPSGRVIVGTEFRELTGATAGDESRSLTTAAPVSFEESTRTSEPHATTPGAPAPRARAPRSSAPSAAPRRASRSLRIRPGRSTAAPASAAARAPAVRIRVVTSAEHGLRTASEI